VGSVSLVALRPHHILNVMYRHFVDWLTWHAKPVLTFEFTYPLSRNHSSPLKRALFLHRAPHTVPVHKIQSYFAICVVEFVNHCYCTWMQLAWIFCVFSYWLEWNLSVNCCSNLHISCSNCINVYESYETAMWLQLADHVLGMEGKRNKSTYTILIGSFSPTQFPSRTGYLAQELEI